MGTNSPPAEASTQGLKCITNTIPILTYLISIPFFSEGAEMPQQFFFA
jgi:hypothetical protein